MSDASRAEGRGGLAVVWQRQKSDYGEYKPLTSVGNGDLVLETTIYRPEDGIKTTPGERDKVVRVRGRDASLAESYRDALDEGSRRPWRSQGPRDLRLISWTSQQADGAVVAWNWISDPTRSTEDEDIAWLNAMREMWP